MFFGTSAFAVPSLRALREVADVTLAVTQPDRASGRGHRLMPTPVKEAARSLGISTLEPTRLRDAVAALAETRPDIFAVVSYGKIVPSVVLAIPRLGALNVHPSLLPLYRGATPLQSALRDGRSESGVSVILMDAGMDTGDLVSQEAKPVGPRETYGELHERFAQLGARMLVAAVDAAHAGALVRTAQATSGIPLAEVEATLTHPLAAADLAIDWSWPSGRILNLVRSLAPAPLARARFARGDEPVKVVAASAAGDRRDGAAIGALRLSGDAALVDCGDGTIALERVVPPNRREMSGASYARSLEQTP